MIVPPSIFALGMPHGSEWLIIVACFIASPVFWIFALVSCMRNEAVTGNTKVVWVLIIVTLQVSGALAYIFIRRPQRIRELGR